MAVKRTGQLSLAEALLGRIVGSTSLDQLGDLVKWYRFSKLLGGLRDGGAGHDRRWCFTGRCCCSRFTASGSGTGGGALRPAVVPALRRARSGGERARPHGLEPVRNLLVEAGLMAKLFGELDRQLEKAGVILKRGAMLDATLIEASSAPPSGERRSRDADATAPMAVIAFNMRRWAAITG